MVDIHPDYAKVRKALAAGRQLTVEDIVALTGRTQSQARSLVNNLHTTRLAEPRGKCGRMTIYVGTARLFKLERATPLAIAAHDLKEAERQLETMDEALRLLLRAFRIGPAPTNVPRSIIRNVEGRAGLSSEPKGAAT